MFICVFPRAFCACKRSDSVCASDRCLISYFGPCQPNTKNNTKIRRLNNDKRNTDFTYGKNLINFIIFFISLGLKNDWFLYVALFITENTVFRTLKMMSWKFLSVKNNSTVCIVFSGSILAASFWFEFTKLSNIFCQNQHQKWWEKCGGNVSRLNPISIISARSTWKNKIGPNFHRIQSISFCCVWKFLRISLFDQIDITKLIDLNPEFETFKTW